jgi:lipid-binding SYLF domain-containing protein
MKAINRKLSFASLALAMASSAGLQSGCSTAPKSGDQVTFVADADAATEWFLDNVIGLRQQINTSAAYVVFPSVGQWGILIGGGQFGRGVLNRPNGDRIGWTAINTGSVGLQAGVRGFKMLMVIRDEATLQKFMANQLTGSVSGVVLVGENGNSARAPFDNGIAVYQGASTGLMAGVNIAMDYIRFQASE